MTSFQKRFELGRSKSLTSPMLKLITAHLSRNDPENVAIKPKTKNQTFRINISSKQNIFDTFNNNNDNNNDNNDDAKINNNSISATTSNNNKPIKKKSYASIFVKKSNLTQLATTSRDDAINDANNNTNNVNINKETLNENKETVMDDKSPEGDNSFSRGLQVSKSGRFREKARVRKRVYSMEGLSLLSVDNDIIQKQNLEHQKNQLKQMDVSQKEFSFLKDEEEVNAVPHSAPLSVVPCPQFNERM